MGAEENIQRSGQFAIEIDVSTSNDMRVMNKKNKREAAHKVPM
jgi:hypothetical protein